MRTLSEDLAETLAFAGIGALGPGPGWRIFAGEEPDGPNAPDTVITAYDVAGRSEISLDGYFTQYVGITFRVRGFDYEEVYATMQTIRQLIVAISTIGTLYCYECTVGGFMQFSSPVLLGRDHRERHSWSWSFVALRQPYNET